MTATGGKAGPLVTGERIRQVFEESAKNFRALSGQAELIAEMVETIVSSLKAGGTVMFCGNGGSAADAQHLAAELMGRYLVDRKPLSALSLSVDTSAMTAIGNDYSFEEIFARQVAGLGRQGDVLVAISTSGNSRNIIRALEAAHAQGMKTIGFAGASGGKMKNLCDQCICVPSSSTPRIQEMQIAVGHMICELVEARFV